MKSLAITCAALLVATMVVTASAAENVVGISKSTLSSMGFASAKVMSDVDGQAVRGKGWSGGHHNQGSTTSASVSGTSTANYFSKSNGNNATATNAYDAASTHNDGSEAAARGGSLSFAGNAKISASNSDGISFNAHAHLVVSGGTAFASAK